MEVNPGRPMPGQGIGRSSVFSLLTSCRSFLYPQGMSTQRTDIHKLDIPCEVDPETAFRSIRVPGNNESRREAARELAFSSVAVAKPLGVYMEAPARVIDRGKVEIGGTVFKSRALSKNLEGLETVYPFLVTIGRELDEYPLEPGRMMLRFFLDTIKTLVLVTAVNYLAERIHFKYGLTGIAHMNPGEIPDWPITEQKPLFSLFHGAEKEIGVELRPGGIMKPVKSRSGVIFENDCEFATCFLCTQEGCPGRRYKYDVDKVREYLGAPA